MLNAFVGQMPMEAGLEFSAIVGLDLHDLERQLLENVIDELDRGLLIQALVDPQHP